MCEHLCIFPFDKEPTCSKYHYEEQLLEKMVRTEIKLDELTET